MAKVQEGNKKTNKLQWFFFVIVVPIIFAITLLLVILTIVGVNPFQAIQDYGSKVPIVSSFIDNADEKKLEHEVSQLQATIKNNESIIMDLENEVNMKEKEIEDLKAQISQLEEQLLKRNKTMETYDETVKSITQSFSNMEPVNAANILVEMDENIALDVLNSLSSEARGNILAAMDAKDAAKFTDSLVRRAN